MSNYVEKIKQRFLAGDLSKPEELYPELIKELAEKKHAVANFINSAILSGWLGDEPYTMIDVGGGDGALATLIDIKCKYVIDKRRFDRLGKYDNVRYIIHEYIPEHSLDVDVAIFSEFFHLFSDDSIATMISECKAKYIIVVENVPDDFLDLRLRLWSNGKCIEPSIISKMLDTEPSIVNDYFVWVKRNNHE